MQIYMLKERNKKGKPKHKKTNEHKKKKEIKRTKQKKNKKTKQQNKQKKTLSNHTINRWCERWTAVDPGCCITSPERYSNLLEQVTC